MEPTVNSTSYATVHIKPTRDNAVQVDRRVRRHNCNGSLYVSIIDKVLQLNNTYVLI
jgi:uncharacterized surface protein with fasciclin (FAS1) repeats